MLVDLCLVIVACLALWSHPAKGYLQNSQISTQHLSRSSTLNNSIIAARIKRFTAAPHPLGSKAQHAYAKELMKDLSKLGWNAKIQSFPFQSLENSNEKGPVKPKAAQTSPQLGTTFSGHNVVAVLERSRTCSILLGGHYDTKNIPGIKFVGANDGGSSTALIMELARILPKLPRQRETWSDCSFIFTLFDGEESQLAEWNEGERRFGVVDHLYGSRHFASKLKKSCDNKSAYCYSGLPISLVIILDMIGHHKQKLMFTAGSDTKISSRFLQEKEANKYFATMDLSISNQPVEDDHIPFASLGMRFIHIIDWENLAEWHTEKDTMEIISPAKIALLGDLLLSFMKTPYQ